MNSSSVEKLLGLAKERFREGKFAETESLCQEVILENSQNSQALHLLGLVALQSGRNAEAAGLIRRAIASDPGVASYHSNLGAVLTSLELPEEAIAAYRAAIALNPNMAEAHNNLGSVLATMEQLDEAAAECRAALRLRSDYASAHFNLSNALFRLGRVEESVGHLRRVLELDPSEAGTHSILISVLNYTPAGEKEKWGEIREWAMRHAEPLWVGGTHGGALPAHREREGGRMRVGYVSADFREHSVAYFLESLLGGHDPNVVDVYAYSDVRRADGATARFGKLVPNWRDIVGRSDSEVAEMIRRDGIDILIDLAGHFAGNRLLVFARKPAPIQITYLGYPGTTGLGAMDYRMTDFYADPVGMTEGDFSEKLLRLPRTFVCYKPPGDAPGVGGLPCSVNGFVTFGSFNNLYKINSGVVELWCEILKEVPGSRMIIKNTGLNHETARGDLRERFRARGIDLGRLELRPAVGGMAGHLKTYGEIDVALDTYPYHGTTTTCEAGWMGVATVTLAGRTHASRVGVSLLTNLGLGELIGESPAEYVGIAVELASNVSRMGELRRGMRGRFEKSPLMDAAGFARDVEAAYRSVWKEFCARG